MSFAERLKELRKYRGMTQKELAEAAGVSCSSIINYENGRRTNPPISVAQRIAQAVGVSVVFLMDDQTAPDTATNVGMVVRCRECVFYRPEPMGDVMMCYGFANGHWMGPDDFCSRGVRKE